MGNGKTHREVERVGQAEAGRAEESREYLPSSIDGELDILSNMSSSKSSVSESAMSPSSVTSAGSAPFLESPFCAPLGLFQACTKPSSSFARSSSTFLTWPVWCGAAGPMPSGAGCVGWRVWSAAEGDPGSCKSMVSAHGKSASHTPAEAAGRRTCSDDAGSRHLCCCSSGDCRLVVRVARRRGWGKHRLDLTSGAEELDSG